MHASTTALNDSFCLRSGDKVKLVPLEENSLEYLQVKILLKTGWFHKNKPRPRLLRVYKIKRPVRSYEAYYSYQQRVQIQNVLLSHKDGARAADTTPSRSLDVALGAEESLLFHGTTRACLLGEEGISKDNSAQTATFWERLARKKVNVPEPKLCNQRKCSLCRVIEGSYDVARCGSRHKFKRFGRAIYTTMCSSKADDYSTSTHGNAAKRFVLLNRVIVGRVYRTKNNSTKLLRAPPGYHAVSGEPGQDLNYGETVVYSNDAIRPAYLLVYEFKAEAKSKRIAKKLLTNLMAKLH